MSRSHKLELPWSCKNIHFGAQVSSMKLCIVHAYTGDPHMTVQHDDILFVCPQPGVEVPAQVHQLLQVGHAAVRPGEVRHLLSVGQ